MINVNTYRFAFQVCNEMTILRRWSTSAILNPSYNEISKYGYNSLSAFILGARYEEETKTEIRWEFIPKIIIYKILEKVYIFNDMPKKKVKDIAEGKYDHNLKKLIKDLEKEVGTDFMKDLLDGWYDKNTIEEQIVLAAIKGATIRELQIIYKFANTIGRVNFMMKRDCDKYDEIYQEKIDEVKETVTDETVKALFYDSIDENSQYYQILLEASENLRKQNRFPTCPYIADLTIIGHLFETGFLAYIMALEEKMSPKEAARYFFMGIWHDFPESFTRDMSSKIKDGFDMRDDSEKSEEEAMEKYVYSKVSPYVAEKIKAHMFERPENEEYRLLTKGADYFAAFFEIMKQFNLGSPSKTFYDAAREHKDKLNKKDVSRVSNVANEYAKSTYEQIENKLGNQILDF